MPDDRLEDLGEGARDPDGMAAAKRLADLDTEPEPDERSPRAEPPRAGGRYLWIVGMAFVVAVVVAGLNSLPNAGRGNSGPAAGQSLPVFAAPLASGAVEGDVNVRQPRSGTDSEGSRPACDVRGPGIVNLCDLRKKPLVITFAGPGGGECGARLDIVDRLDERHRDVSFLGVVSDRDRGEVAELASEHGWTMAVAVDRDRALFNLYRAGLCGSTVFAHRGGRVSETVADIGSLSDAELRRAIETIERPPVERRPAPDSHDPPPGSSL